MARPLRIECEGACYRVMNQGNQRQRGIPQRARHVGSLLPYERQTDN